jgi:hypothetical protein
MQYVYEQTIFVAGWVDGSSGLMLPSWWDHDLASTDGALVLIGILEPTFVDDDDLFLSMPPITVQLLAGFFLDDDIFFMPASVRALTAPDQMLRNEVRRLR